MGVSPLHSPRSATSGSPSVVCPLTEGVWVFTGGPDGFGRSARLAPAPARRARTAPTMVRATRRERPSGSRGRGAGGCSGVRVVMAEAVLRPGGGYMDSSSAQRTPQYVPNFRDFFSERRSESGGARRQSVVSGSGQRGRRRDAVTAVRKGSCGRRRYISSPQLFLLRKPC